MSYSNLTKPSLRNVANNKWCNWADHWSSSAPNMPQEMTKRSFSTATLDHTLLKSSRKLWKHVTGISYLTRHIRQTLPHRTTTCSGRWLMARLSSISLLMEKPKIGSIVVSPQKIRNFLNAVFVYAASKMVKGSRNRWEILRITYIVTISLNKASKSPKKPSKLICTHNMLCCYYVYIM